MSIAHMQDQALRAARDGRVIARYAHDQTVTAAFVVEVGATTYYDIPAGKQVIITKVFVGCETVEEFAAGYIVACDAVAGGGTPTQKSREIHNHIGAKKDGLQHETIRPLPPICLKYSDGHRSVSMAIKATDTATVVGFGWRGWFEDESTLS